MSYDSARALAQRLIAAKGKRTTLTRAQQGAINEITGTRGTGNSLTSLFNAVALPPNASAEFQVGSIIGRRVMSFFLARVSGTLEPFPGDELAWLGSNWKVISVATYDPDASGAIFYRVYGEIA